MSQPNKPLSQFKKSELQAALDDLGLDSTGQRLELYRRLKEALGKGPSQSQIPSTDAINNDQELLKFGQGPVYKRIPKASRLPVCIAFTKILQKVIDNNDFQAWQDLFSFARGAIGSSTRGGKKKKSQATILNKRIEAFMAGEQHQPQAKKNKKPPLIKQPHKIPLFGVIGITTKAVI